MVLQEVAYVEEKGSRDSQVQPWGQTRIRCYLTVLGTYFSSKCDKSNWGA